MQNKKHEGSIIVICTYRPKPGNETELLEIVKEHVPILRNLGLATDRAVHIMKASDGSIVEVFEWVSQKAIDDAHHNPVVLEMWKKFEAACTYESISNLEESKHPFSEFKPLN